MCDKSVHAYRIKNGISDYVVTNAFSFSVTSNVTANHSEASLFSGQSAMNILLSLLY